MILVSATFLQLVPSALGARNHRRQEEEEGTLRVHAGEAGPPQGGFIRIYVYLHSYLYLTAMALLKFEAMPPRNSPLDDDNAVVLENVANTYRIKKSTRKSHPGKPAEILYM